MPASAQLVSVLYALGAFLTWGISDFVGGYTARRFNSFYLAALGHFSGTVLMRARIEQIGIQLEPAHQGSIDGQQRRFHIRFTIRVRLRSRGRSRNVGRVPSSWHW